MNSSLMFKARSWLDYLFAAKTVHQVDSPFIFDFCKRVLEERAPVKNGKMIEAIRAQLSASRAGFDRLDYGTGAARAMPVKARGRVDRFVRQSSIRPIHGTWLNRIVQFWQPATVLELGTAVGISGSYMMINHPDLKLKTIEGDPFLANLARETFKKLDLRAVEVLEGKFDSVLPAVLEKTGVIDMVYIDGHHSGDALLGYLKRIRPYLNPTHGLIVLDDIYWSPDMAMAWNNLKGASDWSLQLDLFQFGLLLNHPVLIQQQRMALIPAKYKPWDFGLFR